MTNLVNFNYSTPKTQNMRTLTLTLAVVSLFSIFSCNKEDPLSPEAEAIKLLITNDINAITDLMQFKVYDAELEVQVQAWNSDAEDGVSFVQVECQELQVFATHQLYNETSEEWEDHNTEISYEDIDNYLIQNNKMIDSNTGNAIRTGNNIVIYLK
jgi:hypothetical protein